LSLAATVVWLQYPYVNPVNIGSSSSWACLSCHRCINDQPFAISNDASTKTNHLSDTSIRGLLYVVTVGAVLLTVVLVVLSTAWPVPWPEVSDRSSPAYRTATRSLSSNSAASPVTANVNASIVVIVTTKAGSRDRCDWLRQQHKRNIDLLRQADSAAADSVGLKCAISEQGLLEGAETGPWKSSRSMGIY
jgi:hypothetical protein